MKITVEADKFKNILLPLLMMLCPWIVLMIGLAWIEAQFHSWGFDYWFIMWFVIPMALFFLVITWDHVRSDFVEGPPVKINYFNYIKLGIIWVGIIVLLAPLEDFLAIGIFGRQVSNNGLNFSAMAEFFGGMANIGGINIPYAYFYFPIIGMIIIFFGVGLHITERRRRYAKKNI